VNLVARAAERWCFRLQRAAVFACVSNGVAGEVRSFYPRLASRVITIHNGVDTEHFAPAPAGAAPAPRGPRSALDGDRLSALFVGGEWEGKGLRPLLEALKLAPGWDLLVAGRGDRERYEQLARRLGVASAVHWLGVVGDVRSLYRRADAFVLPSTYETFSLVTFEAAACGLPVLVTPVSGVSELIVDGENGFFITREPETIALRLRELGADAGLCERLGRGARAAALRFSSQRMVECYDRLFSQIAAPAGQAPEAVRSAAQAGGAVA
jgi:UDP-glucose:(heptosyl)LPS alpha-1,3-glucosyltransferase